MNPTNTPNIDRKDDNLEEGNLAVSVRQSKTDGTINSAFKTSLRKQLLVEAAKHSVHKPHFMSRVAGFFMNTFTIGLASGLLIAVAATSLNFYQSGSLNKAPIAKFLPSDYKVASLPNQSFGSLSHVALVSEKTLDQSGNPVSGNNMVSSNGQALPNFENTMPLDGKIIAPEPYPPFQSYTYKYAGDKLPSLDGIQPVYKREKTIEQKGVGNFLDSIRFGMFNLNKLENPTLNMMTFSEDRDFGYTVNVDFENAALSVYQNYKKWPQPKPDCVPDTDNCASPKPMSIDQYPQDDAVINLANGFIQDYNIPISNYGKPFVDNSWRIQYEKAADKTNYFLPNVITVIYPVLIDNKIVYDESGNPIGLNIVVDITNNKVSGVYNLTPQQYQMSAYDGETDTDRIIKLAEQGGFRSYPAYPNDPAAPSQTTIQLGTPSKVMTSVWQTGDDGNGSELFVPALMFPITNTQDLPAYFYQKAVIIPLVKDILDSNQGQPVPLPYLNQETPRMVPQATPLEPQSVKLPDTTGIPVKLQ